MSRLSWHCCLVNVSQLHNHVPGLFSSVYLRQLCFTSIHALVCARVVDLLGIGQLGRREHWDFLEGGRERGREGGRERGREREGERERGREGERERGREREREGEREGGRRGGEGKHIEQIYAPTTCTYVHTWQFGWLLRYSQIPIHVLTINGRKLT